MKKYLYMSIVIFLLSASNIYAQTVSDFRKMSTTQKADLLTDSIKISLNLDDMQTTKLHSILQKGLTEVQPIMQSDKSRFSKMMQLRKLKKKYQPQIKSILTTQQWTAWESKKKNLIACYKEQAGNIPLRIN